MQTYDTARESTHWYLDSNATTAVLPAAAQAAQAVMLEQYGNPSSSHAAGRQARAVLEQARQTAAKVIGSGPGQIVFNSGATEGIQTAVLSALCAIRDRRNRGEPCGHVLAYGATEHKAVAYSLAHWNQVLGLGLELRALPVDASGRHDLSTLALWMPDLAMLCTMAANNETGVITDLAGLEALVRQADASGNAPLLWLVDCVQALGKLPLDLAHSRADYAVFSGHKLYAPKGVGLLYVRQGAPYTALMAGGGQEHGLRGGTENLAGIAAFAVVLEALLEGGTFASHATLLACRDALEHTLCQAFPAVQFNANLQHCLPTTLNFSVPGIASQTLLEVFDAAGLQVSAGSACSAAASAPSYVLRAMGLSQERAESAVRLSFGPLVDTAFIESACQAIACCADRLQNDLREAGNALSADTGDSQLELAWEDLEVFLQAHPQARLVDVRDAEEHRASQGILLGQHRAHNAPLAQLMHQAAMWLDVQAPVVFVCHSGSRSLRAARWLREQGHSEVRHVRGGLAARN